MNHSLLVGGGDGPPQGQTTVCPKVTRPVLSGQRCMPRSPALGPHPGRKPAHQPCEPTLQLEKTANTGNMVKASTGPSSAGAP